MKWSEVNPLPAECTACEEQSCYSCDHAGKRWILSETDNLLLRRRLLEKAIARAQKQIKEIDNELAKRK